MKWIKIYIILVVSVIVSCSNAQNKNAEYDWDANLKDMGMIDVCFWEPSIQYYLVYRTSDNFTGKPLYTFKLTKVWLHPRAAKMLIHAQELLHKERPDLSLLVYDAARPMEIQRKMWTWAKQTHNEEYVANPSKGGGGMHNYGLAVDLTLVDKNGEWLPMGTPFDYFGQEANINNEDDLLKRRRITPSEYRNRKFLRHIMESAGFTPITSEWWHFNACSIEEARADFVLIDR